MRQGRRDHVGLLLSPTQFLKLCVLETKTETKPLSYIVFSVLKGDTKVLSDKKGSFLLSVLKWMLFVWLHGGHSKKGSAYIFKGTGLLVPSGS